eukprot:TRINITY_DN47766_c0_g1_i1.p1 TRINITY_DN47766_c0_g1~~TRINITY_DN47766_c0_g1_i1.p1  ORF type:complete len:344 (-),score=56.37 TRINITY_DN47766_c0_g1_i1:66-1097(-)
MCLTPWERLVWERRQTRKGAPTTMEAYALAAEALLLNREAPPPPALCPAPPCEETLEQLPSEDVLREQARVQSPTHQAAEGKWASPRPSSTPSRFGPTRLLEWFACRLGKSSSSGALHGTRDSQHQAFASPSGGASAQRAEYSCDNSKAYQSGRASCRSRSAPTRVAPAPPGSNHGSAAYGAFWWMPPMQPHQPRPQEPHEQSQQQPFSAPPPPPPARQTRFHRQWRCREASAASKFSGEFGTAQASSGAASRSGLWTRDGPAPPREPPPTLETSARMRAASQLAEVKAELDALHGRPAEERRLAFREAQRRLHPDKNPLDREAATVAFQELMAIRRRYVDDD